MGTEPIASERLLGELTGVRRLSDVAYEAMREAIISARIAPGTWLRQQTLASELGVSQATVRDALSRLIADGLAVQVPYKGVRSVSIPIEDARDIVDIRALLEGLATELAGSHLDAGQFAQLRKLLPDSVMHKDVKRAKKSLDKNREFHWVIIDECGRDRLKRILRQVWELQGTSRWVHMTTEEERAIMGKRDSVEHEGIVHALEEGRFKKARQLAVQHVQNSIEGWIAVRARLDNVPDDEGPPDV